MWMYLAAFVDCDGWITSMNGKSFLAGLTQHESCSEGMQKISDFLAENNINHTVVRRNTNMINIHIKHQESLLYFLKKIRKYLLFKGNKADTAIEYLKKRLEIRALQRKSLNVQVKKKYWSNEEVSQALGMLDKGYSKTAIAGALGRSKSSVYKKLQRLKETSK